MQIDLEKVPPGSEFKSDICVIGAGIAGLVLSQKLAACGYDVHLLEAGGQSLEQRSQDLYRGQMKGVFHQGTTEGRFRTYGGASTRWGGQLLSYPEEVFQERALFGNMGWPITGAEIKPHYAEIFRIMGVNDLPFTDDILKGYGTPQAWQSPDVRVRLSKFAPFGKRNLARTLGKQCLASNRITVFFHANATSVDLSPAQDRIESVTVKNYQGGRFKFTAREYVVCTGTIETSRLLLSSNAVQPAGVGNLTDQVGRYFHDHLTVKAMTLGPGSLPAFTRYFAPYFIRGTLHSPKLEATFALQKKLGLPEVMAHFFIHEADDNEFALLRQVLVDLQRGKLALKRIGQVPLLLSGVAQMAYALKVRGRRILSSQVKVTLNIETEQRPRPDSRIQVSDRLDALGMPETIVDWKISPEDGESLQRYAVVIDQYLESLGMNERHWKVSPHDTPRAWAQAGEDIFHPMGGTRMGASPEKSVVDRDLHVHGVANLSIASCSVFPFGGSSNPTFTMMALALRLAEALQKRNRA